MTSVGPLLRKLAPAALVLAWLTAPAHALAATACATSAATLHGWYGMLVSGATLGSAPKTKYLAGALLFDGAGGLSGINVYGQANAHTGATGTYVLNTDCTLTMYLTLGTAAPQTFTVNVRASGEAVGIETDAAAVATISLKPQYATYTPGLNFSKSSLNGTYAANCIGPLGGFSDVNLGTFNNGVLTGTDPYNNSGAFATANIPYSGTYSVNTDGTFTGTGSVGGTTFNFYGVVATANTAIEYFFTNVANGAPTDAIESCTGATALGTTGATAPSFSLSAATNPLSLKQNSGGTDLITVTPGAGFSGSVSLAVSGAPAGVGTAFSGNALIVFPPLGTPVGSYPLTITGTSGAVTATLTLPLNVTPGASFSLAASPTALTVVRGKSGIDAVKVTQINGFSAPVSFAASGLPAGATAVFSPATSAAGSSLTISVGAGTATGSYPVTVSGNAAASGNSNAVTQTVALTLTVQ